MVGCFGLTEGETEALASLQSAWHPPGWEGSPSCSWIGVNCDDFSHAFSLVLTGQGLKGTIPQQIGGLSFLFSCILIPTSSLWRDPFCDRQPHYHVLSSNALSGSIPASLGQLFSLARIHRSHNFLTGSIPSSLGSLRRLEQLWLSSNQLDGSIPSGLSALNTVGKLSLNDNLLTGNLPLCFGNLTTLDSLLVQNNALSEPYVIYL